MKTLAAIPCHDEGLAIGSVGLIEGGALQGYGPGGVEVC